MKKWLPKPDLPGDQDISPAELDAMANEDVSAVEGDDMTSNDPVVEEALEAAGIETPAPPPADPLPRHALDDAPVNSKIIVLKKPDSAILATPEKTARLPDGDPAHRLPEGVKIFKRSECLYDVSQIAITGDKVLFTADSALSAIEQAALTVL